MRTNIYTDLLALFQTAQNVQPDQLVKQIQQCCIPKHLQSALCDAVLGDNRPLNNWVFTEGLKINQCIAWIAPVNSEQPAVICVVGEHSLNQAGELYDFFTKLGCYEVGFNFEEKIGINNTIPSDSQYKVKKFWEELFVAWKKNPVIEVREFSDILNWMSIISEEAINKPTPGFLDLFPSVSYSGDVVLLSPEFLDAKSEYYNNFVVGNVLSKSLISILFDGEKAKYVSDFNKGLEKCLQLCEYSEHCMGGQASSKFFELGSTNGTETTYCRNSEQFLIEAVLTVI